MWGTLSNPLSGWKANGLSLFSISSKEPLFAVSEHKPFVIVVPSYNSAEWVEKNLSSIFAQKYDNYRVLYIDDASIDGTFGMVNEYARSHGMSHRIQVIHNDANRGACENIYRTLHLCRDEEIAVLLDGDDWFAHDRVLQRLNEIYANPNVWMTYGSYIEYPSYGYTVANFAKDLPSNVVEKNTIREYTRKHWCLSHLRTFYIPLFKKVKAQDLQWNGKYYDAAYDLALMIPIAEMAGEHAKYVKDVFYIYNQETSLNDNKIRSERQQLVAQHILELPVYARLSSLSPKNEVVCSKELR
jgi:glycosyltransferase involved in cell wall biosynthesis